MSRMPLSAMRRWVILAVFPSGPFQRPHLKTRLESTALQAALAHSRLNTCVLDTDGELPAATSFVDSLDTSPLAQRSASRLLTAVWTAHDCFAHPRIKMQPH
eukprot:3214946-Pyramimonas_sp.AAC.1